MLKSFTMPALALTLLAGCAKNPSYSSTDIGTPVTVRVLDESGKPVPTAVVRHPDEAERHRVNTLTGEWTESVLYMADGSEFIFDRGTDLVLEISAPGYMNQTVRYLVRRRGNVIPVTLTPMTMESDDIVDDPVIQFGRDRPID